MRAAGRRGAGAPPAEARFNASRTARAPPQYHERRRSGAGSRLGRLEVGFHDERVLAGVVVIAAPAADDTEAERLVERAGLGVTRPHLEDDLPEMALPGFLEDAAQESAREAAAPAVGAHGDVGDVDLVGDLPETEIPDHLGVVAHHPAARDPVLLDLVEEGPPRPRHREGRALDREDRVEILSAHELNGRRYHDA